jgi:membrane protease YdiL (CAAX protease family)
LAGSIFAWDQPVKLTALRAAADAGRLAQSYRDSMISSRIRAVAAVLAMLLSVYVPAFAVTSLARPVLPVALALVIAITMCLALAIIWWLVHRGSTFSLFGFARPSALAIGLALVYGLPLALGVAWFVATFPYPAPFDLNSLTRWQQVLFFTVAAPVQEEVIFRGLVQSFLQARWLGVLQIFGTQISYAVIFTAILFAIIHLGSGWPIVIGAVALSLLAGELRRRSGSLLPAVAVHSLFNAAAMLAPST